MKKLLVLLAVLCAPAFGQVTIDILPPATLPLTGTENVAVSQNKATRKTAVNNLAFVTGTPTVTSISTTGNTGALSTWAPQFHANWNVVQTGVTNNPTEWQIYNNASQGIVQVIGGTNQVVRVSGTPFSSSWVGLPYFYYEGNGFKVLSVTDSSHLTVQTIGGGTVTWGGTANGTYYFVTTSATSTCNVGGTAVTYVSGQPFISTIDSLYINGSAFGGTVTFNSPTSLTLSSSGGSLTNATCIIYKNIGDELDNFRLQGLAGSNEEGFVITNTPGGAIMQSFYAGSGKYRHVIMGAGELPIGTLNAMVDLEPNTTLGNAGTLSLGGLLDSEAIRVPTLQGQVNRWQIGGNTAGNTPYISVRGPDSSIGADIDMHGASTFTISTDFSFTHGQWFAVASANSWPTLASSASNAPVVSANGAASNIPLVLSSKGTSPVSSTSPVQLPSYTVATLPTCNSGIQYSLAVVTDASAPTYNAALTGGGAVKIPVFCNGATWTSH